MKRKIMIIISTILCSLFSANGQNIKLSDLDVNGIKIGEKYTDAQVRAAFGSPLFFKQYEGDGGGDARWYDFGTDATHDWVSYNEDYGGVTGIMIVRPNNHFYGGRIKIGDNISKMQNLGFSMKRQSEKVIDPKYRIFRIDHGFDYGYCEIEVDSNNNIVSIYLSLYL